MKRILWLILLITTQAIAQKLPNTQTASLRTPANIKIDGKATEWNNQFQAYNTATDIFYTIANDKEKLYVVMHSADEYIIKKMIWGRVMFSINRTEKKESNDNITISYPIIDFKNRPDINFKDKPKLIEGNPTSIAEASLYMSATNKRFNEKSKFIKVTGVKGLDTLIAVYNTDGIQAAGAFDNKMAYTHELAIDLKVLGIDANDTNKFFYRIVLNKLPIDDWPEFTIKRKPGGEIESVMVDRSKSNPRTQVIGFTNDFWGEYTLAK
ncbi:MAG: hypothetical protein EOP47_08415 [Sphingobacteriaceae bacterium]|nr:MAG: hypothetical protein EOP47_08415 [Sphingobacteriaceae bacterium]